MINAWKNDALWLDCMLVSVGFGVGILVSWKLGYVDATYCSIRGTYYSTVAGTTANILGFLVAAAAIVASAKSAGLQKLKEERSSLYARLVGTFSVSAYVLAVCVATSLLGLVFDQIVDAKTHDCPPYAGIIVGFIFSLGIIRLIRATRRLYQAMLSP